MQFGIAAIITEKGESAIYTELIIHTTSTSASWTPTSIVNSGDPLTWSVSGGVDITEVEYTGNTVPTYNFTSNSGTAIISIKSYTNFIGLTELRVNGTDSAGDVIYIDVLNATELIIFSCKLQPLLTSIDISTLTAVQSITLRDNAFTSLNVSSNTSVIDAYIYGNALTSFNALHIPLVTTLYIYGNNLSTLELDKIINNLDTNGQINGNLAITDNTGNLSSNSYTGYQNLISKGWTIDVTSPDAPSVPDIQIGTNPILSNFHTKNTQLSRVYFDSSEIITATTATGFTISGKSITNTTPIVINTGQLTDHYINITTEFTFWDNVTIRYEGGSNIIDEDSNAVINFTLTYVINNIVEPVASIPKYASSSPTGLQDGSTEANASSLTYALANAVAGETWWCKAGNYGAINLNVGLNGKANGTATNPIKFIGYKTNIEDIISNYFDYGVTMSTSEMPTLTNGGSAMAFELNNTTYCIFRNFQIQGYQYGIRANQTTNNNLVFERINIDSESITGSYGIWTESFSAGAFSPYHSNNNIKYLDIVSLNGYWANLYCQGEGFNLFDGVKTYNDNINSPARTDYQITFGGDNNIVRNCHAENFNNTATNASTHGIGVRGSWNDSSKYNLIEKSTAVNLAECFYVRNRSADYNVIKDCEASAKAGFNTAGGVYIMGGADYNIIERVTAKNLSFGVGFNDSAGEDGTDDPDVGSNNTFRNCIFDELEKGIFIDGSDSNLNPGDLLMYDNKFVNCTFNDATILLWLDSGTPSADIQNLDFINCIFNEVPGAYGYGAEGNIVGEATFTYSDFYLFKNSSGIDYTPSGTGNISVNPQFTDTIDFIPKNTLLKEGIILTGVKYDINNVQREIPPTIGAVELILDSAPIIYNFRIEDSNKDRIYFDSTDTIENLSIQGFIVSGKTINSIYVNQYQLTGHYFVITVDFDFWDNNTIRLENGDGKVYDFTLTYIENNIIEPSASIDKYVAVGGSGDGTSEGNASSLSYAFANCVAGETWNIKAGNYGNVPLDFLRDGTVNNPIKFIGYKTIIGDITSNYFDNLITFSTSEMPTITSNGSNPIAVDMNGSFYVIFRNIQYTGWNSAILGGEQNGYLIYDRINVVNPGATCMKFASGGSSSSRWLGNDHIRILDCVLKDGASSNLQLYGTGSCLIDGLKTYGNGSGTDYQIAFNGDNSIVRNCFAGNTSTGVESHGIGVRGSWNMTNQWNLIELSETDNCAEGFYFRNYGTDNNVIKNCIIDDTVNANPINGIQGIAFMNHVSNNIAENIIVRNTGRCIHFQMEEAAGDSEATGYPNQTDIGSGNIVRNCLSINNLTGIGGFVSITGTSAIPDFKSYNNTFIGEITGTGLAYFDVDYVLTDIEFKNCIIQDMTAINGTVPIVARTSGAAITDRAEIAFDYTSRYNNYNNWTPNGGTGNIEADANLDGNNAPQNTVLNAGLILIDVDYDKNGTERSKEITAGNKLTIGAIEINK